MSSTQQPKVQFFYGKKENFPADDQLVEGGIYITEEGHLCVNFNGLRTDLINIKYDDIFFETESSVLEWEEPEVGTGAVNYAKLEE